MADFFYFDDERIALERDPRFVALKFDQEVEQAALQSALGGDEMDGDAQVEALPFGFYLLSADRVGDEMGALGTVAAAAPVFTMPNGEAGELLIGVPRLRVQFVEGADLGAVAAFNATHGVEVLEKNDLGDGSDLLGLTSEAKTDVVHIANEYHRSDLVIYAEPDWVMFLAARPTPAEEEAIGPMAPPVSDPLFARQWALAKMRVPEAWRINKGSSGIKVAIIDEGTQTSHPDLKAKIVTPYDAVGNDSNQEPYPWNGHGTACAGIAAASSDNAKGIAGVAQGCKILPVRIAYSAGPKKPWITNPTWIARGIITAAIRGADVLSNSWGGGAASTVIRNAFRFAQQRGRGGKGCVTICAAGNNASGTISYPARYAETLACGASNEWDQLKTKTSNDGETWWGSQYGKGLDFLAPGVHIYTTDISGPGGYRPGDYVSTFNGTSSATPNAAGVAALVLSVDPSLRHWEVADILRLSAKRLSTRVPDLHHGWGRLDARKALEGAARVAVTSLMRPEFLGQGKECFMRLRQFKLSNSGLNRVRINRLELLSRGPRGRVLDRFEYKANPGGIMMPGLSPTGGSGHTLEFKDLLFRASGNRRRWSYSLAWSFSYSYWRPSHKTTGPADAAQAFEEVEVTITGQAVGPDGSMPLGLTLEAPQSMEEVAEVGTEEAPEATQILHTEDGKVQISITVS